MTRRPNVSRTATIDKRIGKTLGMLRWSAKMTQEDLAKAARISKRTLIKYEHAESRLSASRLFEFAQILGVDPGEFFRWIDDQPIQTYGAESKADQDALELARLFRSIEDREMRRSILEIVGKVARKTPSV